MSDIFLLLLAGHLVGDWIIQTDWQAANKVWGTSRAHEGDPAYGESWRANQMHCLTYHLTMAAFVLPVWRTWGTLAAFVVSWATHGFIDRRWPVRWLLARTGSARFAEQTWGVLAADQALHIAILAAVAAVAS